MANYSLLGIPQYPVNAIGVTAPAAKHDTPAIDLGYSTKYPPVFSVFGGIVVAARMDTDGARFVVIFHPGLFAGKNCYTLYWHLASISVVKGQSVAMGEQVGIMGKTGKVTGMHLHFELWVCPKTYTLWNLRDDTLYAVDPQKYLYAYPHQVLSKNPVYSAGVKLLAAAPALAAQTVTPPATGTQSYKIARGDTLSGIAVKFETTVSAILAINPRIKNANKIYAGTVINVPRK